MDITVIKVGVDRYEDGSGYAVDVRYEAPKLSDEGRWPGGILWIEDNIICNGHQIDGLIQALQYIRSQIPTNQEHTDG